MAVRIGVYLCSGCGIGEAVEMSALHKVAGKGGRVAVVRESNFLCGPGNGQIQSDIAGWAVDAVVVAGCSPRFHVGVFDYGPQPGR